MWHFALLCFQLTLSSPVCPAAGGVGAAFRRGHGVAGGCWVLISSWPWELRVLASLVFQITEAEATLVHAEMLSRKKRAWKAEVSFQTSTSRDGPVCWAGCWAAWELYIYFLLLRYQTTPPCKSWDYLRCHCAHQAPGLARRSRAGCFPPSPRNHALPCTLLLH